MKLRELSEFEFVLNKDGDIIDVKFVPATNDRWCNKHIPEHMFTWRANTDASAVTSAMAIIH